MARVRIEEIVEFLGLRESSLLRELREEGLFLGDELEEAEAEELRIAACLVRDLGVNPAGVQVVLHMRRRLVVLEHRVEQTLRRVLDESR